MADTAGFLDLSAIAPKVSGRQGADRMFVVGRSGSGKSFLARALLDLYDDDERTPSQFRARVCVFDPNGTFDYEGRVVRDPTQVEPSRTHPVIIYRPSLDRLAAEDWNEALKRLFNVRGRILLLIDEFTALDTLFGSRRIEGGNYLTGYMSRGRALGKGAIIVTQAPSSIPLTVIRNAERFATFDLPLFEDRDRMARVMGVYTTETDPRTGEVRQVDLRDRAALGKFQFWYYGPPVSQAIRIRVKG